MSSFSALKTAIQAAIKQNGNNEITGDILQDILLSIVSTLGDSAINNLETGLQTESQTRGNQDTQLGNIISGIKNNIDNGYVYAGIATPSTTPVSGKVFYIATQAGTYTNLGNTAVKPGISILKYNGSAWSNEQVIYTDGGVFDVSAYNGDATYASLEALLSDANLSTIIPSAVRRGGMSIKFVHTDDNKYIRYNLIANEFTTDVTKWAIDDGGVYVENPEFVDVKTDKDGRILWAIRIDGSIYWGAGVPQQVIDYIQQKIAELSLDECESIVAFLNGLEEGDKTLQQLLNEKVDKEEGKSLIDNEYASTKSSIDNPEFLEVTTDSEDKVLEGIQQDGTKVIGGDLSIGGSAKILGNMEVSGVSYKVIENQEYLAAWVDTEDKIIFGLKTDGKTYIGDADFLHDIEDIKAFIQNTTDKNIDWNALSSIITAENPEYIEATTDSEEKILAGRTPDGAAFENVGFSTPKVSIDGHTIENFEDPEGRTEIENDAEGKIISYRDSDGVKHENAGIETDSVTVNHLNLTESGMTEFQQALKDTGFKPGGHGDWSEYLSNDGDNPLILPSPKCAKVNVILPNKDLIYNLLKEGVPGAVEGVNYNVPSSIEYYDNFGNYFKKPILISAQGQSTLLQRKRNLSIDLFDSSVYNSKGKLGKGDAFKVKIGEWVSQDSFHLKGFYTDILRCRSVATYRVYKDICKSRGLYNEYIWKKGLLNAANIPYRWQELPDNDEFADYLNDELDTGATCIPDGFPIILYVNGELFGCYSWQLKKHRDNYKLNKSDSNHVWIDSSASDIWNMNGNLDWSILKNIEVRNPKDLYVKNDNGDIVKYNVDDSDSIGEFIDSTMEGYDPTNKDHVRTNNVKTVLSNMSTILPRLVAAEKPCIIAATNSTYWEYIGTMYEVTGVTYDSYSYVKSDYAAGDYVIFHNHIFCAKSSMPANTLPIDLNASHNPTDAQVVKDLFETYFDVENLIDYQIISQFVLHWDNWGNNWQWITYDGIKWYCSLYDCDQVMVQSPSIGLVGKYMFCVLIHFYKKELDDRYEELKDLNILSKENLIRHIESYIHAWGEEYYMYDVETHGYTRRDTTLRIAKWIDENIKVMNTLYV